VNPGLAPGVSENLVPKRRTQAAHRLLKKRKTMDDKDQESVPPQESGALIEPPEEAVARLEREVADLKDKYLRLAAEYDNFRKRALKERTEAWEKAQADLVLRLVDALDDLARFAHVDPAQTDAKTIHDGVDLVERKLWKELEAAGVTRVDQSGVPFDPNLHEAVTTGPADHPAKDHTVGTVLQPGYQMRGALIRPARVVVLQWQGDAGRGKRDE
jgi:molecular chaperone GrpE